MSWTLFLSVHMYWLLVVEGIFIVFFAVAKSQQTISKEDAETAIRNGMTYDKTNHTYTTVNRHTAKRNKIPPPDVKQGTQTKSAKGESRHKHPQKKNSCRYSYYDEDDVYPYEYYTYEELYNRRHGK